jgi:hypothetical protein
VLAAAAVVVGVACTSGGDGGKGGDGGGAAGGGTGTTAVVEPAVRNEEAWPVHMIDARYKGANALGPGDVNGDGRTDYVTNYEFDQRYVIAVHPGEGADPRLPWPTVTVFQPAVMAEGFGVNTESAALGDLDGDGNVDVVGAQGYSTATAWEGSDPGIRILWGPPVADVLDPAAWTDGGKVPSTVDVGHLHWVTTVTTDGEPLDLNGDGLTDVLAGGRVHAGNGSKGGVFWLEAPADPAARRDLTAWRKHDIDPDDWSGHGSYAVDVDGDGDLDVLNANADFDTPVGEETAVWYENPGEGSEAQRGRWTRHELYRGDEFHTKPQLVPGDLDADGRLDLVVQTPDDLYWFRRTADDTTVAFERIVVPKDPRARFRARTLRVADIDGDGRDDVVGMLTHLDGDLPGDKAAVFWMSWDGDPTDPAAWTTHVVKWGSGLTSVLTEFGEKYDQVDLTDVDGDGDLDIVTNNEEWWSDGGRATPFWVDHAPAVHAVLWFENRVREPPFVVAERDGLVEIEAERPTTMLDGTWLPRAFEPGFDGTGYLQDGDVYVPEVREFGATKGVEYAVDVAGGAYTIWLRRRVPSVWGWDLGGGLSDSTWVGVDGAPVGGPVGDEGPGGVVFDEWVWVRAGSPVELAPGSHRVVLRAREGGYAVDRIVLSADPTFSPSSS